MDFASEMVIKASLFGLDIKEVPTTLSPDGRSRPPHLRSWRDGWLHLKLLLTLAPYWLFFYPGLALAGFGTLAFTALMFGPVHVGDVSFDLATLVLAGALIITGVQMVWFFILARLFAVRFRLLPTSPRFDWLQSVISVDRACIYGGALLITGLAVTVWAVAFWGSEGFGDLDPAAIVRPAALAVVCASLGVQTITTGFMWGLLNHDRGALPESR
jgi:hypothetical protein